MLFVSASRLSLIFIHWKCTGKYIRGKVEVIHRSRDQIKGFPSPATTLRIRLQKPALPALSLSAGIWHPLVHSGIALTRNALLKLNVSLDSAQMWTSLVSSVLFTELLEEAPIGDGFEKRVYCILWDIHATLLHFWICSSSGRSQPLSSSD